MLRACASDSMRIVFERERPLQLVPDERLLQQPAGVHDQVAAVRPVQRAGLDQREVGDRLPSSATCSTRPTRLGYVGWSSYTTGAPVVDGLRHEHVHLVAVRRLLLGAATAEQGLHGVLPLGRRQEVLGVVDHVLLDLGEVLEHRRHVGPARPHLVDQVTRGGGRDQPVQLAQLLPLAARLARQRDQHLLQLALQRGHLLLDAAPLVRRQLLERVGLHHLPVAQRGDADARLRAQDGDAALPRPLLERPEGPLALVREARLDELAARAVVLALEDGGDRRLQLVDQLAQVLAQQPAPPRGQAQRPRPARVGEVVDVAPVGRRGLGLRPAARETRARSRACPCRRCRARRGCSRSAGSRSRSGPPLRHAPGR